MFGSITADIQPHEAASRIQAHSCARRQRCESSPPAVGRHSQAVLDQVPAQDGSRVSAATRSASFVSAADYERLRTSLKARPTCWPSRLQDARVAAYLLLEEPRSSRCAQALSMVILICILCSILAFMLETMPELKSILSDVFFFIEVICTAVFTIEYLVRLFVCNVPGTSVWKFLRSPMNLIDLFAILPFYLWLFMKQIKIAKVLGILRTVRLVRLFRVFKLGRYSSSLQLVIVALRNSSQALWVLSFFLGIGIVLFSSAIYYVEKMGCPDRDYLGMTMLADGTNRTQLEHYIEECRARPGNTNKYGLCCTEYDSPLDFPTIIDAFWWSIVTMTTVGFGEVGPKTFLGKIVGTVTMLSGILLIALPIAIIGRKFQEAYDSFTKRQGLGGNCQDDVKSGREVGSLTMSEMGRRLKFMRLPDASLANLARELAEELEEVGTLEKEILSMQASEEAKQLQIIEHFGAVLSQLCKHAESPSSLGSSKHAPSPLGGSAKQWVKEEPCLEAPALPGTASASRASSSQTTSKQQVQNIGG